MQIVQNKVVTLEYTLTDATGNVLDATAGREPLAYIHGMGNIIPGLETALEGRSAGDNFQISISPEDAYGERHEHMVQVIPRDRFEGVDTLDVGMQFQAGTEFGPRIVTITTIEGDDVTVDANHPLAGTSLNFDVTVAEVRDATTEELEHGHTHGPEGHEHD